MDNAFLQCLQGTATMLPHSMSRADIYISIASHSLACFLPLSYQVRELAYQFTFALSGSLSCETCTKLSFDIPVMDFMLVVPLQPTIKESLDLFFGKEPQCERRCPRPGCNGTCAEKQLVSSLTSALAGGKKDGKTKILLV